VKVVLHHCYTGIAHNLKHNILGSSFIYRWYFIIMLTNFSFIFSFHFKFTYIYARMRTSPPMRIFAARSVGPNLNTEPLESDTVKNLALSLFWALDWFRSQWVKDYLAMTGSTWGSFRCLSLRLCRLCLRYGCVLSTCVGAFLVWVISVTVNYVQFCGFRFSVRVLYTWFCRVGSLVVNLVPRFFPCQCNSTILPYCLSISDSRLHITLLPHFSFSTYVYRPQYVCVYS